MRPVADPDPRTAEAAVLANRATARLQVAAVTWRPLASLLGVAAPRPADWALVAAAAALPVLAGQGWKLLRFSRAGGRSAGEW